MDNSAPQALDGLRALLHDWKEQGIKIREGVAEISSPREEPKSTKDQRDTVMASVYSQYHKMATQEDRDLVTRWTETLNILLTFAGLLSAVITAFLLASQPDLQPQPLASTNKILLHIAHQLDNTTDTSQIVENAASGTPTLRVLSYWHASLGCSLMSAFGSLLSKQWVLHYQSSPIWANTIEEKCRLREIRAYGLSKWQMYAIIESLPVLLQAAVFLFYLGLAESVQSTPILFRISIAIATVIATFFIFTFLAGAFFASCPFKSPVAGGFFKLLAVITWLVGVILVPVLAGFAVALSIKFRIIQLNLPLLESWWHRIVTTIWAGLPALSERLLAQSLASRAGIIFWWLQGSNPNQPHTTTEMRAVTDVCVDTPPNQLRRMAAWRGGLGDWCIGVFKVLRNGNPTKSSLLEADLICYLINRSIMSIEVIKDKLVNAGASIDDSAWPYVCTGLRKGWTNRPETAAEPKPLQMEDMPPNALAVYLESQLCVWESAEPLILGYLQYLALDNDIQRQVQIFNTLRLAVPGSIQHPMLLLYLLHKGFGLMSNFILRQAQSGYDRGHAEFESETICALLQELPIVLKPDYFSDLTLHTHPVIRATALAAIALVPMETSPHIQPIKRLVDPPPLEKLLQSLHRLSYYPINEPSHQLVAIVVATASRVIKFENNVQELRKCYSWNNGKFEISMSRLMHLGRLWWHAESGTDQLGPGACLVREIQSLMNLAIDYGITNPPVALSKILPISPDSLAEVFSMYAHPQAPLQSTAECSSNATKLLNFALTSRYVTYQLPSGWSFANLRHHLHHLQHINLIFLPLLPFLPLFSLLFSFLFSLLSPLLSLLHHQHEPPMSGWSITPSCTLQLEGRIQVLRQLIHNLGPTLTNPAPDEVALRKASLTTVVMGRDIFLPSSLSTQYPSLTLDLSRLASEMTQTAVFSCELTEEMFLSFDKWDELLQALGDLLQSHEQSEQGRHQSS